MKKLIALVLVSLLMVSLFSVALADTHGLALLTNYGKVKDAGTKDGEVYPGEAPVDSIVCSVVLDDNGVIKSVRFDTVQIRTKFDGEGKLAEGEYAAIPSKIELGDGYGMKNASSIGKEWFEQIAAFEEYCVGKTVEQVLATPTKARDEKHPSVPDLADLATSVTMDIGHYMEALEKAAGMAK